MILCSGCFDGLHAGHVRYLQAAADMLLVGEGLCVAVAPDDYIRRVKGREPRWPLADRIHVVLALRGVDYAVPHAVDGVANMITTPVRLLVKGIDWIDKMPMDVREACLRVGTEIHYVDTPGVHTSEAFA